MTYATISNSAAHESEPPRSKIEAPSTPRGGLRNWDEIRLFIALADFGSFRSAARELGISANTLTVKIDHLEQSLRHPLVTRHADGIKLTGEGELLLEVARQMSTASRKIERFFPPVAGPVEGAVSLCVTEGIGTFWLVPRLVEFQRRNDNVRINLDCSMQPGNVSELAYDISVQLEEPTDPSLMRTRLGFMHVMPFASEDYLRVRGVPTQLSDLVSHRFVEQIAPQVPSEMALEVLQGLDYDKIVAMRTNTSSSHYWAVAKGAGLGLLPTYARAISRKVVPVDIGFRLVRSIWMVYHPDLKRVKRVKATMEFLKSSFSTRQFPWFKESFTHPDEFETTLHNHSGQFEGFLEAAQLPS